MSEEKKFTSEDAKKKAQEIGSTVMTYVDKGVELSKKGIEAASKSLSDFGNKSVIKIEIAQLNGKIEKKYKEIGTYVAEKILSGDADSVSKDDAELADKLAAIFDFKEKIAQHEEALKQFEKKEEQFFLILEKGLSLIQDSPFFFII